LLPDNLLPDEGLNSQYSIVSGSQQGNFCLCTNHIVRFRSFWCIFCMVCLSLSHQAWPERTGPAGSASRIT